MPEAELEEDLHPVHNLHSMDHTFLEVGTMPGFDTGAPFGCEAFAELQAGCGLDLVSLWLILAEPDVRACCEQVKSLSLWLQSFAGQPQLCPSDQQGLPQPGLSSGSLCARASAEHASDLVALSPQSCCVCGCLAHRVSHADLQPGTLTCGLCR